MRRQRPYDELKQIECLEIHVSVLVAEQLSQKKLERFDKITCSGRRDRRQLLLNELLDLYDSLQALFGVRHSQFLEHVALIVQQRLNLGQTSEVV